MGNPAQVSQWNPSTSEPTITQPRQVCNCQQLQALITLLLSSGIGRFPQVASNHANLLKQEEVFTQEKCTTLTGLVWYNSIELLDNTAQIRLGCNMTYRPSFSHTVVAKRKIRNPRLFDRRVLN